MKNSHRDEVGADFFSNVNSSHHEDRNKNRLRAQDIHKIVDVFNRQIELPRYSRMVPVPDYEFRGDRRLYRAISHPDGWGGLPDYELRD